jgi:N-acylglucosamine-6-phosphate 2-epimerase
MRRLPYGLIASVQASGQEPLNQPTHLLAMAHSCLNGGALGLRLSDVEVIKLAKALPNNPFVIGLTKPEPLPLVPHTEVYITPTLADACLLAAAGADMVALDATQPTTDHPRPRPEPLATIVAGLRHAYPHVGLMADCATLADAMAAQQLGFDVVSTTLSGYTTATLKQAETKAPDFELLSAIRQHGQLPVALEGRVWTPDHVAEGFARGACAVIVGSAVTRPQHIVAYLQN